MKRYLLIACIVNAVCFGMLCGVSEFWQIRVEAYVARLDYRICTWIGFGCVEYEINPIRLGWSAVLTPPSPVSFTATQIGEDAVLSHDTFNDCRWAADRKSADLRLRCPLWFATALFSFYPAITMIRRATRPRRTG